MFDIRNIVKNRKVRDALPHLVSFLPDKLYLRLYYFALSGRTLHLKNPKGYNEKLQWIKIHDKHLAKEHGVLVDKLRVKDVIKEKIGDGYCFPLLGYWEKFDDIDFDALPNAFVLKCNHDSGSYKIIRDKASLTKDDFSELKAFYTRRLKADFFKAGREYPYKGIKPYIIAETLMGAGDDGGINDFKFFCFNGEPKVMLYVTGRQVEKHEDYFDMDYQCLHLTNGWTESKTPPLKPACFEEMKELAAKLSKGLRQVRMDFYEIDGKVYFGEYTFFSGGGFELFKPEEWEQKMGDWIDLSKD